jgi:hypothetical protein
MTVQPFISNPSLNLNGLGIDWGGLLNKGVDITGNILQSTVGTPAGTYTRTGADGSTVVYRQPTGSTIPIFGATDTASAIGGSLNANNAAAGGLSTVAILGIGGLVLFLLMSRR